MPFKKGTSGNPYGRTKGTTKAPNKSHLKCALEKSIPQIEIELETATPEARRDFLTDLARVVMSSKYKQQLWN